MTLSSLSVVKELANELILQTKTLSTSEARVKQKLAQELPTNLRNPPSGVSITEQRMQHFDAVAHGRKLANITVK
eukprot:snap_masked-scaffold_3-processed-gene-3.29-mRNA-1 protein AED:1.00 eAED:1.00 QI:0/0/0/0/1/1/2/0/74